MLKVLLSKQSMKFLKKLNLKNSHQIKKKLEDLAINPKPNDCALLKGTDQKYLRVTSGEYRIIYRYDEVNLMINIIGKRNDGEVYKKFARNN